MTQATPETTLFARIFAYLTSGRPITHQAPPVAPGAVASTITPGDLRFAASELLAVSQRFRLLAVRRRGSAVVADELLRDAERLTRVAYQMCKDASRAG